MRWFEPALVILTLVTGIVWALDKWVWKRTPREEGLLDEGHENGLIETARSFFPVLAIVRTAKILENATDYSVQNTARQALFLPTSREAKYNAKQAIDSFFWRAGDLLSAALVFIGSALAFSASQYAFVNLTFMGVWLTLVVLIVREHRKLVPVESREEVAA